MARKNRQKRPPKKRSLQVVQTITDADRLIGSAQVMKMLDISESTLRRMLKDNQLPGHIRIRGRHKFRLSAIRSLLDLT